MKKVTIKIETTNAMFDENPCSAVVAILRSVAHFLSTITRQPKRSRTSERLLPWTAQDGSSRHQRRLYLRTRWAHRNRFGHNIRHIDETAFRNSRNSRR